MGFKVQGLWYRVKGFRDLGLGFEVWGVTLPPVLTGGHTSGPGVIHGSRAEVLGIEHVLTTWGSGLESWGLEFDHVGFRVRVMGFRV